MADRLGVAYNELVDDSELDSRVHARVMRGFVDRGVALTRQELSRDLDAGLDAIDASLQRLDSNHGVVLGPGTGEVWLAHPFSSTPTLFLVEGAEHRWWAPCIWCALGVVSLAPDGPYVIRTQLGGEGTPCEIRCGADGTITPDLVAHFPVRPADAWANVHRHCACTLVFESERDVDEWCGRRRIERGEVLTLAQVGRLADVWYGRHLDEDWKKPSVNEAQALFERAGLTSEHWRLPTGDGRF